MNYKDIEKELEEMIRKYGKYNYSDVVGGDKKYKIEMEDIHTFLKAKINQVKVIINQRPIKFRAWNPIQKFWTESFSLTSRGQVFQLKTKGNEKRVFENKPRYIIMQFTGLLDKSGKEIYEGDIVRLHCFNDNLITATIKWNGDGRAEFYPEIHDKEIKVDGGISDGKMVDMRTVHSWAGMHSCFSFEEYIEVIGNIYENKELLK